MTLNRNTVKECLLSNTYYENTKSVVAGKLIIYTLPCILYTHCTCRHICLELLLNYKIKIHNVYKC